MTFSNPGRDCPDLVRYTFLFLRKLLFHSYSIGHYNASLKDTEQETFPIIIDERIRLISHSTHKREGKKQKRSDALNTRLSADLKIQRNEHSLHAALKNRVQCYRK